MGGEGGADAPDGTVVSIEVVDGEWPGRVGEDGSELPSRAPANILGVTRSPPPPSIPVERGRLARTSPTCESPRRTRRGWLQGGGTRTPPPPCGPATSMALSSAAPASAASRKMSSAPGSSVPAPASYAGGDAEVGAGCVGSSAMAATGSAGDSASGGASRAGDTRTPPPPSQPSLTLLLDSTSPC